MKKKWQLGIIALLLIIIALLLIMLLKPKNESNVAQGIVFEPNTKADTPIYAGTNLPGISIPGWTAIRLPAGVTEADVSFHNPEENTGYYDLSFTLKLKDTGEILFTTGLVKPGYRCSRVELNRTLVPGEYQAVLSVQPYLQDEARTPTNNAELEILLIVE